VKLVVGRRRTGRDGSPPRNWQISCWCGAAPPALWRSRLEDALVQHGGPESVDSVMVDGRWLMRGQALLAFDEAAALTEGEGSGRRFAGAHGSAAGDVGRNAAGARLGRCRATGSSYLATSWRRARANPRLEIMRTSPLCWRSSCSENGQAPTYKMLNKDFRYV